MNLAKKIRQWVPLLSNSVYQLLPSGVNLLLSLWVVTSLGSEVWGAVVEYQLFYYLSSALIAWGNKEYLLLQFSKEPAKWKPLWQESFLTRLIWLGLPIMLLCFGVYDGLVAMHVACWIFSRFITQSVEVLVVYRKTYLWALISETLPLLLIIALMLVDADLSEEGVLWILTATQLTRVFIWLLAERLLFFVGKGWQINFKVLKYTVPFMLLSLSGFLQAKIDLYGMGFFANKSTVGTYQVFTSYINLFLLVPGFLILPHVKNIYRLNEEALKNFKRKLVLTGLLGGGFFVSLCYIGIRWIYKIEVGIESHLMAYFYIASPFFFTLSVYQLFKKGGQQFVLIVSFIGIGINLLTCYLLIPHAAILGAMTANVLSQIFLWVAYWWGNKKLFRNY